ncbi:MAG: hypothetical protein A3B44_03185 [Candidatus Levybacteria bacterium RIFCSPLOWO2_01_FULL_38_21]|nr:MAG: hypothetical protein A3B44_03185 [Candidatus Levybacteria bacterium RIFCSPLOWO2_01_FULL_38_21]
MKLPLLPFLEKKESREYFLALVLRNEKVNAVFFEESLGKVSVLGKHSEYFENSIEQVSLEELLGILDKAISTAEQSLPENVETVKTIFGVKGSWVEDNKIKKDYLLKLKRISDELGLVPIGFLVAFEAIVHLLQKEEGAPVTAILVETGEKYVSVAHIKAGKIIESKTSEIIESPAQTVDNLLKHFSSSEILPSRIIIFNGDEDESQEFINHRWSKSLPFLHLPQATTLPFEFDSGAVLFGAAQQMGFEVLEDGISEIPPDSLALGGAGKKEEIQKTEGKKELEDEAVTDKIKKIPDETSAEYFGFAEGKDILKEPLPKEKIPQDIGQKELKEKIEDLPAGKAGIPEELPLPLNALMILDGLKSVSEKLLNILKKLSTEKLATGILRGGKGIIIPAVLIFLIFILAIVYLFTNKASVVLNIDGKTTDKTQNVTFSQKPTDPLKNIIQGEFVSVSEDGTISTQSTGKKEVGTNAKGTVTVFNNAPSSQTLSKETTITSSNGLDFTLDKSVTVSSASGDIFSGTTPGKTSVSATAKQIGQEYNLPSNTKFSILGSTTMAAKNDNPFSGGTKKEITVVSKDDIAKLLEDLPKNLEQKAKDDLSKKVSDDKVLLPVFISRTISKKDFDKDTGDEAKQVTLKGSVNFGGIAYKKSDSTSFANELLKTSISADLTVDPNNIKIKVKDIKENKNKEVNTNITIVGTLVPKIDEEKLSKQISGKSFKKAEEILERLPQVSGVDINLSFNIPFFPKRLPFSSKNVKITTKING